MIEEAEKHREEDERFRRLAEARNQAEALAYQIERTVQDLGDKLSEDDKKQLQEKAQSLRKAAEGEDEQAIWRAIDEAKQHMAQVSQRLYEAAASSAQSQAAEGTTGQPGPGASGPGGSEQTGQGGQAGEGGVIDAEFEAEDES